MLYFFISHLSQNFLVRNLKRPPKSDIFCSQTKCDNRKMWRPPVIQVDLRAALGTNQGESCEAFHMGKFSLNRPRRVTRPSANSCGKTKNFTLSSTTWRCEKYMRTMSGRVKGFGELRMRSSMVFYASETCRIFEGKRISLCGGLCGL